MLKQWNNPLYKRMVDKLELSKEDMVNLSCYIWGKIKNYSGPEKEQPYFRFSALFEYVKTKECKS